MPKWRQNIPNSRHVLFSYFDALHLGELGDEKKKKSFGA